MLNFVFQIKSKNMNVKVFNLMSRVNGTCECKCGLNERVCNSKPKKIVKSEETWAQKCVVSMSFKEQQ